LKLGTPVDPSFIAGGADVVLDVEPSGLDDPATDVSGEFVGESVDVVVSVELELLLLAVEPT